MTTFPKRAFLKTAGALALGATALAGVPSAAAQYPERPVTMVVPFPPGGTTDIAARAVANAMQEHLGQTLVVENRAGAGGNVGMGALSRARPDGYTIGLGTIGTQSINSFIYPSMPFDPETDFEPIALVLTAPNIIAVRTDSPYQTIEDLVEDARQRGDESLTYGTPGVGSSLHLAGALIQQMADIEMLHVPFQGVSASMPALAGGQIDILLDNLPSTLAHVRSADRIRGLAVTSPERTPALPDMPTVSESGLPGFEASSWFALYAPKGTPPEAMETLIDSARKALASEKLRESFTNLGGQVGDLFGEDLRAFEEKERARWSQLVSEQGIKAE